MSINYLLAANRPKTQKAPEQHRKDFARDLGNNIAAKRDSLHLGQRDLAYHIGSNTAVSTISRWENAAAMPDAYALFRLSQIFGCSCDELLSGSSSTPDPSHEQVLAYIDQAGPSTLSELLVSIHQKLDQKI